MAVIDRGDYYEAKILDGLFVFEPNIKSKNEGNSDMAENIKRDHIVKEAVITARIKDSSNHSKIKLEREEDSGSYTANSSTLQSSIKENTFKLEMNDGLDDIYDKDFGLKLQEKKRKISAFFSKEKTQDKYPIVESALSLTTLKNYDDWDYERDGKKNSNKD